MESGIHSVESGIQDSRGLPYMGRELRNHDLARFLKLLQVDFERTKSVKGLSINCLRPMQEANDFEKGKLQKYVSFIYF